MKNRNSEHFDKIYSSEKVVFGGGKPESFVEKVPDYVKSGKVLDIGGGEGRNAIFLAQNGFDVEVVDVSKVGLEKAKRLSEELNLNIKMRVADITEEELDNYDVVIFALVLHLIRREKAQELIKKVKEHTNKGGLNFIMTFTKEGDFYKRSPDVKSYYPDLGELEEVYKDWNILEYEERETRARAKKEDDSPMFNITAFLLAQKKD